MRRSIACACGERTIAANVCLGSVKSSPNVPAPVIKRWSSRRKGELPIPGLVMVMFPSPHRCEIVLPQPRLRANRALGSPFGSPRSICRRKRGIDLRITFQIERCCTDYRAVKLSARFRSTAPRPLYATTLSAVCINVADRHLALSRLKRTSRRFDLLTSSDPPLCKVRAVISWRPLTRDLALCRTPRNDNAEHRTSLRYSTIAGVPRQLSYTLCTCSRPKSPKGRTNNTAMSAR